MEMEEQEKKEKKKSGAPKGNANAWKYGFYSKDLNHIEKMEFKNASGIEGIDEEIALLRVEIKKAISGSDGKNLLLLVKAAAALDKLVRTRYQITSAQNRGLKDAVATVVKDFLIPMGVNIGSAFFTKKIN
jgi:hypothetical protein